MSSSALLSECDGGPIETVPSLWYYLRHALEINSDGIALIIDHQKTSRLTELLGTEGSAEDKHLDQSLVCTFTQLHEGCLKLCAGLIKEGVQPGDTISVFLFHGIEFVLFIWAAAILKVTLAVLDPGSLLPARHGQLLGFLKITKPNVVVVSAATEAEIIEDAVDALGVPRSIGIFLESCSTSSTAWKSLVDVMRLGIANPVDEDALHESALHDDPARTAWIYFTSGTSVGSPKGCPRTVHSIAHYVMNLAMPSPKDSGTPSRFLVPTANYRIAAGASLYTALRNGYTVILSGATFDPGAFIRTIAKWQVNSALLIPSQFYEVARHPEFSADRMKSVVMMTTGGDIITRRHFEIIKRMFPSVFLHLIVYSMTEGSGWVMGPFSPALPVDQIPFVDDICPAGRVKPGTRVRIWNSKRNEIVRRGETGELIISSRSIIPQYLGSDSANKNGFFTDEEGCRWFRTGDRAMMNDSGLIYITGRTSSIFKRGGVPVNPVALEKNIASFLGADQLVCVVPVPSRTLGHAPLAVISSLAGREKKDILDHNIQKFGDSYALADVVEMKELGLDVWPINAAGKVMKTDILAALDRSGYAKELP